MIGDRHHDVRAARANGARAIGVLWGYGSAEELAGADARVRTPAELVERSPLRFRERLVEVGPGVGRAVLELSSRARSCRRSSPPRLPARPACGRRGTRGTSRSPAPRPRISRASAVCMSVSMTPGRSEIAAKRASSTSAAITRVSISSPAFAAQ
jgi:hypothetical protein